MSVKIFTTSLLTLLLVGCGKDAEIHRYTEIRKFPQPPPGSAGGRPPMVAGPLSGPADPSSVPPGHPSLPGGTAAAPMRGSMQGREGEVPPPPSGSDLVWTSPEGWEEMPGGGMRLAAFRPEGAGDRGLATLIVLGAGAGGLEANVKRWRRQVGLPEEHKHDHVEIQGGLPYVLVNLVAESAAANLPSSTIGAIYTIPGRSVFLKFTGDTSLLVENKAAFLALAQSISLKEEAAQ